MVVSDVGGTEAKTLRAKVEQLEKQLAQERIKVRQLQDRVRQSEGAGGDPEAKLQKALKLIVQVSVVSPEIKIRMEIESTWKGQDSTRAVRHCLLSPHSL